MREYAVVGSNQTVGAATAVWVSPLAGYPVGIYRVYWGQSSTAASAQQRVQLNYQVSSATNFPTVVGVVPQKLTSSDPVSLACVSGTGAAGTCGITASAEGSGAKTILYSDAVNNLNGFLWVPSPSEIIRVNPTNTVGFGLFLPVAPGTTSGQNSGIIYGELA